MGMKIIGMGNSIPKRVVANDELAAFMDTSDEWIISKTGIISRTVCTSESLTDLAEDAARAALSAANADISDVDLVIGATMTGDYFTPSLACCLLERFGSSRPNCSAYDINAACTGFIYALDAADSAIKAGKAKTVLIVAAEMMSRMVDWSDRTTSILFGDGACACIIAETKSDGSLKYIRTVSDAQIAPLFAKAGSGNSPFVDEKASHGLLEMQGQHVYKFAVKAVEKEIKSALSALNMQEDDVDFFILHQANTRIIDGARARLKLPPEKFPMNIQKYGNMSAASIPILLCEMVEDGRITDGNTLMLIGFGAGMTAGCAVYEY